MRTLICKIPPNLPLPKGGIPPYQRGVKGVVIPRIHTRKSLCLIALLLFLSCSSEKPEGVGTQKPSETAGGGVSAPVTTTPVSMDYSLEISPLDASRISTLSLIPRMFDLNKARIEWLVNGVAVPIAGSSQFKASEIKKGDKVQARAIIDGKEILSNVIEIKNAPPELTKIKIMPEVFKAGDVLYVDVVGSDPDEDEVTILYEWTKNGESVSKDKQINAAIKRGDKLDIKITPYDGKVYGRSVILHREIKNLPPMIIVDKNSRFDGNIFTYQVKASDADNDALAYSLKAAPQGMTIDKASGLLRWDVPEDFKGKASFTVVVSDGHGGEASQAFVFEVIQEKK